MRVTNKTYRIKTARWWYLIKWCRYISELDIRQHWFEPIRFRKLAKRIYGTDVLDEEYFRKFGTYININGRIRTNRKTIELIKEV